MLRPAYDSYEDASHTGDKTRIADEIAVAFDSRLPEDIVGTFLLVSRSLEFAALFVGARRES